MIAIIDAIIAGKYAKNEFQAAAIANGLQLYALETEEECMARVKLYRAWRDSGVFGKETAPCFEKAIAGEKVPELFDEPEILYAPWTAEQVHNLAAWQADQTNHPYTCGSQHKGAKILTPTKDGWICKYCGYKQNWCHAFTAQTRPSEINEFEKPIEEDDGSAIADYFLNLPEGE